jgi:hypothetical protein
LLKSISGQNQSWFVYLLLFRAADYGQPHDTEFVPLLRATIELPGMPCRQWDRFHARGREHGGGMYVKRHPVLQIIHKYC